MWLKAQSKRKEKIMKKYIITLVIALGFTVSLNAQMYNNEDYGSSRDGFFSTNYQELREGTYVGDMGDMPRMIGHGMTKNQSAPIGSGVLLLACMGLAYGASKKNR